MMGTKAPENCGSCDEKLPKTGDFAACSACTRGFHLDSCSIKKKSWNSLGNGQATWVCLSCRKAKKSSSKADTDEEGETASNPDIDLEVW